MIHAEISIYPMATRTTSASFYIARAIESIRDMPEIRHQVNPMGTTLESESMSAVHDAVTRMTETVHNLGINRICVVIKIDSRRDKSQTMEQKIESVKRHADTT